MKYTAKQIGLIIKESREKSNISLTEFAERIGEDKSNLSKIERGELNIKFDRFLNIVNNLPIYIRHHNKKETEDSKRSILESTVDKLKLGESVLFPEDHPKTSRMYLNRIQKERGKKFMTRIIGENLMIVRTK